MPRQGRTTVWCFVALVMLRVVIVGVVLDGASTSGKRTVLPGDVRRFHQIASKRGTPYTDFQVEYPPLTLAAIEALNSPTVHESAVTLMWTQLVLDVVIAAMLVWGWGRRAGLVYLLLGLAFAWYPFLYLRLDLVSVALAVGGLALIRRRRMVMGSGLVAAACFAKIWPLALAPAFLVRRSASAVAAFVAVGVTGCALWLGWTGVAGPIQVLTLRGARGWQIESSVGAVLHLASGAPALMERGAARIGIVPDWARIGLPALGLLIIAGVWLLVARVRKPDARVLDGLGPVAAIAALLLCATVLSPQYVSWLLPFAAIAAAAGERAVAWLTASAAFLSTLGLNLVKELNSGETIPMLVVLARNAALLALLVTAVVRIVRLARDDRAPEPITSAVPVFAEPAIVAAPHAIRRPEAEPVVPVPM